MRNVWRGACAALLLAAAGIAGAAGLQVSPTTVEVEAQRRAGALMLVNTGERPLSAQVRVFGWRQEAGEDLLEPTADLAVSPPMLELPPGGTQLVRVIRLGPPPPQEASYRIIVDELPLEQAPDQEGAALHFVMRYSVPVFLAPAQGGPAAHELHAQLVPDAGGRWLELRNRGDGRAQVADLAWVAPDGGRTVVAAGLAGYVLPGQYRRWELPAQIATPARGAFQARINGEASESTLALDP